MARCPLHVGTCVSISLQISRVALEMVYPGSNIQLGARSDLQS
jgi:hypothetical protein